MTCVSASLFGGVAFPWEHDARQTEGFDVLPLRLRGDFGPRAVTRRDMEDVQRFERQEGPPKRVASGHAGSLPLWFRGGGAWWFLFNLRV